MQIGIVCEGPSDFAVLEQFLPAILAEKGIGCNLVRVQPDDDATSAGVDSGWTAIYKWCVRYLGDKKSIFLQASTSGLFDGGSTRTKCDLLLILIDTDVSEKIKEASTSHGIFHLREMPIETAAERGAFAKEVLSEWLDLRQCSRRVRERCLEGVCVECIETWVVAACLSEDCNAEELAIELVHEHFIRECLALEGRPSHGARRIRKKNPSRYGRFAKAIAGRVRLARNRCTHFEDVAQRIERFAEQI